jgi:ribosome-associated protein
MKHIDEQDDIIKLLSDTLEDNKAEDIKIIDFERRNLLFEKAIIATGTSSRHVVTLADKVCEFLKQKYNIFARSEGYHSGEWILIDAGTILISLFQEETRNKYKLEEIWSRVKRD